MKLLDHNTEKLKDIWVNPVLRQNAEIVIMEAVTRSGADISVIDVDKILEELADILKDNEEDNTPKKDRAL